MTNSITPPPELVKQWEINATLNRRAASLWTTAFATQAAQWGADQELEACCQHVDWVIGGLESKELRAARRPKPPSLKEQALESLERMQDQYPHLGNAKTIRRALEALDD
jgi:hypothetical protein